MIQHEWPEVGPFSTVVRVPFQATLTLCLQVFAHLLFEDLLDHCFHAFTDAVVDVLLYKALEVILVHLRLILQGLTHKMRYATSLPSRTR
jgi:hypothetical protein